MKALSALNPASHRLSMMPSPVVIGVSHQVSSSRQTVSTWRWDLTILCILVPHPQTQRPAWCQAQNGKEMHKNTELSSSWTLGKSEDRRLWFSKRVLCLCLLCLCWTATPSPTGQLSLLIFELGRPHAGFDGPCFCLFFFIAFFLPNSYLLTTASRSLCCYRDSTDLLFYI